jgi:hypothetical protein
MRRLIDDPGVVAYPYSVQGSHLEVAYEELRGYWPPEVTEVSLNFTGLSNTSVGPLVGSIMFPKPAIWATLTAYPLGDFRTNNGRVYVAVQAGVSGAAPGPTGTGFNIVDGTVRWNFVPQAKRITRLMLVDSNGGLLSLLPPASSFENLGVVPLASQAVATYYGARWWLDGTNLRFSSPISGILQVWYQPLQAINWPAAIIPGSTEEIDGLPQFHDLIALLAAQQYQIMQGRMNPALQSQLDRKLSQMQMFFAETRSGQASRWVSEERW